MEAEVREILADAVPPTETTFFNSLMGLREQTGGVDIDPFLPTRRAEIAHDPFE